MPDNPRRLTWADVQDQAKSLAAAAADGGLPEVVVGIARGGLIPAVMISHILGVRCLQAVTVTHTADEGVNAAKTPEPVIDNPGTLTDLAGRDVLLVDDVAGTGDTLTATVALLAEQCAARVRTAVLCLNTGNWQSHNSEPDYVADRGQGWVVFPWEA